MHCFILFALAIALALVWLSCDKEDFTISRDNRPPRPNYKPRRAQPRRHPRRRPIVETNPDDWGEREIILPYDPRDRKYPWYQPRDPNAPKPAKETNPDDWGEGPRIL